MKRVSVFAMLCALTITLFAQPAYAAGPTVELIDGGVSKTVSAQRIKACEKMYQMSQMPWKLTATLRYCYGQDNNNQLTESSKVKVNCRWDNKLANEVIPRRGISEWRYNKERY